VPRSNRAWQEVETRHTVAPLSRHRIPLEEEVSGTVLSVSVQLGALRPLGRKPQRCVEREQPQVIRMRDAVSPQVQMLQRSASQHEHSNSYAASVLLPSTQAHTGWGIHPRTHQMSTDMSSALGLGLGPTFTVGPRTHPGTRGEAQGSPITNEWLGALCGEGTDLEGLEVFNPLDHLPSHSSHWTRISTRGPLLSSMRDAACPQCRSVVDRVREGKRRSWSVPCQVKGTHMAGRQTNYPHEFRGAGIVQGCRTESTLLGEVQLART
jgi:hypothetical protein